jgi:hypothetical protein
MTKCECATNGYCNRHEIFKTEHLWNLCRNSKKHFDAWETKKGPGQFFQNQEAQERKDKRASFVNASRALWDDLFLRVNDIQELLIWERRVPSYGCECKSFYDSFLRSNHPGETVSFEWKWRLKSAVNKKLGKDNLELKEAMNVYDINYAENPTRSDIVAITALSPNRHSLENQQKCVQSWERFGLQVFAKNTDEEIAVLKEHFPTVEFISSNEVATCFSYPTQRIQALARTAVDFGKAVLLINSDCELRGSNDWLQFDEASQFVGVRWNYDAEFPRIVTEFRYGFDAFSFTPKQSLLLPDDFPFAIGHPMWDYAVPALMRHYGIGLNIVHRSMLFHCNHNQNWQTEDWFFGQQWVKNHIGLHIEYSTKDFRDSLEKTGWRYNHTRWIKHV